MLCQPLCGGVCVGGVSPDLLLPLFRVVFFTKEVFLHLPLKILLLDGITLLALHCIVFYCIGLGGGRKDNNIGHDGDDKSKGKWSVLPGAAVTASIGTYACVCIHNCNVGRKACIYVILHMLCTCVYVCV